MEQVAATIAVKTASHCTLHPIDIVQYCETEIGIVKDLLTIFGILIAGYYGYMRFVHGRVYQERLTPSVKLEVRQIETQVWLVATSAIRNTGARRVAFTNRECLVSFFAVFKDPQNRKVEQSHLTSQVEKPVGVRDLFKDEMILEPSDVIEDTISVLLDDFGVNLFKAEFRVSEESRASLGFLRRKNAWSANTFAFVKQHGVPEDDRH